MQKTETRQYHVRVSFGAWTLRSPPTHDLGRARQLFEETRDAGLTTELVRTKTIEEVVN